MFFFFFKQKTAYEMRISDWSSDVCSSDLVVVLATRAHAFLRGGGTAVGALLVAGEDVLELHHARVGEQQRRIVARHQRRGRHGLVAVALKIAKEGGADVVASCHDKYIKIPRLG